MAHLLKQQRLTVMEPWFLQNHTGRLNILTAMLLIIIRPGYGSLKTIR